MNNEFNPDYSPLETIRAQMKYISELQEELKKARSNKWYDLAYEHYENTAQEMLKSGGSENFIRQSVSVPMVEYLIKLTGCDIGYFEDLEVPVLREELGTARARITWLQQRLEDCESVLTKDRSMFTE